MIFYTIWESVPAPTASIIHQPSLAEYLFHRRERCSAADWPGAWAARQTEEALALAVGAGSVRVATVAAGRAAGDEPIRARLRGG